MASNKKAQILAAVMCASSIFGSYTVVSAETPATTISNNSANNINKDTAKVVASENNDSGTITATVKDSNGTETSKITLNGEKGTFALTSKNLKITEAGAITGTGLTINGTSASNITSYNNNNGTSAKSTVAYNGVTDTVTNGTYTTTSTVAATGITDTVKNLENNAEVSKLTLSTTNAKLEAGTGGSNNAYVLLNSNKTGNVDIKAGTVDGVQGNVTLSGKNVNLNNNTFSLKNTTTGKDIAKIDSYGLNVNGTSTSTINSTGTGTNDSKSAKSEVNYNNGVKDTVTNGTYTTTSTVAATGITDTVKNLENNAEVSKLTLSTTNAKLEAGTGGSNNAYVLLNSNKTGNVDIKAGTVDGVQGNVTLSGKNASLTSAGLTVNGTNTINAISEVSKTDNSTGSTITTTTTNKTTSSVVGTGVTDTVTKINNGGVKDRTTSSVTATAVTDNVYDNILTDKPLATSNITKGNVKDTSDRYGSITLTANKYGDIYDDEGIATSNKQLGSTSLSLSNNVATISSTGNTYDEAGKQQSTTASMTLNGNSGIVSLSGKNVKLDSNGLYIYDGTNTSAKATISKAGAITGTGLNITSVNSGDSAQNAKSTVSYNQVQDFVTNGAYKTTSTVGINGVTDSIEKMNGGELENKVSSTLNASGLTTTVQSKGNDAGIENTNSTKNKTTSQVAYNSVTDTVYDANGKRTSYSNVGTTSISDTVYDTDGNTILASSSISKSGKTGKIALTTNKYDEDGTKTTSSLTLDGENVLFSGKNASLTSTGLTVTGLTVNGTGTSSIKSTNSTTEAYVKNEITSGAMTTTARGGMYPSDADNKNKTTSQVSATGVRDTVYDDGGQIKATSSVTTSGIANTVNNSSITNTVNDVNTGKPLADSRLTTSGISNTTTALQMTGTNAGNTMSTGIYQNNGGISATATKKGEDGATIGISTLTLGGDNASLKVGNYYGFAVDSNNNVSITGNNATLSGNKLTLTDVTTGKTATLDTNGLSLKDANGTQIGGVSAAGAVSGTSLSIKAPIDPIKPNNDYVESKVTTSGVADTIKQGGFTRATSNVTINSIKDTIYTNDGKELSSSNISKSVSDATESGSVTLIANKITTNDDATTTTLTSKLNLTGDSATLTSGSAYVKADNTTGNVLFSGNNATLSGSTFTLKDGSNNTARLTATGLSFTDASGQPIGGVSSTGAITGTSLNITAKNDSGNKTISKVDATGVTDTVYGTDGTTQVAYSNVGINGIYNNTNISGIAIKDDEYNTKTMNTSIAQNANGVSISSNKYNVYNDGTSKVQTIDGISTISVNGAKTTISGYGNYEYKKDENGKLILDDKGNPIRSSNTSASLSVDGESGIIGLSGKNVSLGASGLSLNKVNSDGTTANYGTWNSSGLTVTATNTTGNKTTSQVSATGVTDRVYDTDGKTQVAYSNVGTGGITNSTNISGIAIKDDKNNTKTMNTSIAQNANGVNISSTKYNVYNDGTSKVQTTDGTSTISVNGAKTTISGYGNYEYKKDENGKLILDDKGNPIRSSNTSASLSVDGESGIIGLSGKNVSLGASGLSLNKVNSDGTTANYGTWNSSGLTVTATNTTGNKTTSQVSATGTIDQVYDVDGKTRIAYSNVTTTGITDSFTKDGITNSVTTNANGTTFSSTGNGFTTIKGDTIKTTKLIVNGKDIGGVATDVVGIDRDTDGLGTYTQIEGKTKIYNTGRFSTANGNFVVDPYGSIASKAGNYRFNMDRTSGFDLGYAATTSFTLDNTGVSLGFRNNSFILDKNGATFINANGENVSFTSINGGTITTGETVINGSSITTKDLYVDNIHLNGAITDGNGNVVGGGDLSLGADGTLDLKYNANGITNTFVSGATGVHSSFSNGTTTASSSVGYIDDKNTIGIKDQVGNTSVTTTTDGTTFANGSGSTTINGGNITTTGDVTVGGDLSVGDNFKVDGTTGNVTGGTYNGVQISTDKDGNAIIGGTNIGDLATNEEVNKVNDKVDAVDNKVGDTSKLDKEITDNQNYKDNQNLVGAVNAEADIRRNEISRIDGQIEQLDGRVGSLENRMSDVEDRIDKVGAMSAAIANLRTMGYDPEAPTEIAIGVGQYKSETGLALGVFHYPNQDFMLSASISTSGDEVMGGIGATWKLGRKSAAEKAKDEEARRLEKAEEMKKLAQDAKVKAQAERHAKLLAEREAQKTA